LHKSEVLCHPHGGVHRHQAQSRPEPSKLSGDYSSSEELLGSGHYHEISGKKDGCDHEEKGIIVDGRGIGRIIRFCRAPECKKHWAKQSPQGHYKPTAKEKAARKRAAVAAKKRKENEASTFQTALSKIELPLSTSMLSLTSPFTDAVEASSSQP
jgi:hypothetical protein